MKINNLIANKHIDTRISQMQKCLKFKNSLRIQQTKCRKNLLLNKLASRDSEDNKLKLCMILLWHKRIFR